MYSEQNYTYVNLENTDNFNPNIQQGSVQGTQNYHEDKDSDKNANSNSM